jgi:antitoxin HigA-1
MESIMETAVSSHKKVQQANPVHPGSFVKAEIIEAHNLSVTDTAKALGVTRAALSAFINKHSALSPDMALRIEKAFGVTMDMLMRLQNSYDIAETRKRANEINVRPFKSRSSDQRI